MKNISYYIYEAVHETANMFCILKPGFLKYKDEFIKMLESNGWEIIQHRTKTISLNDACELYKMHEHKDFYEDLTKYMNSSKSFIVSVYKDCKDPVREMDSIKKQFREKYGVDDMRNGMHSSDSPRNVKRECNIFFD